jgi:hypothetical protein
MLDDNEITAALREWAKQIRSERYATAQADAELLERAAALIERLSKRQRS